MPPAEVYPAGGLTPGKDDLPVSPQQMLAIPFFSNSKGASKLKKCQEDMVLRIFNQADQVICQQGTAGASAFFILSEADVYGLYVHAETTLQTAEAKLRGVQNPAEELRAHVQEGRITCDAYRAKLPFLGDSKHTTMLKAAHEANVALAQRCRSTSDDRWLLTASAWELRDHAEKVRTADATLADLLVAAAGGQDDRPAASVHRHALRAGTETDLLSRDAASSRQVTMGERELFGEMACKNRQPRAADVHSARPCFVLEILSNVLKILEEDNPFQENLQRTYVKRVVELHLREFSLFRHLAEDRFQDILARVSGRLNVIVYPAGKTICEEGVKSDAVFLIRRGWVQVKVRHGSQQRIISYRGPGEFIGEMGLIQTPEHVLALKRADFSGVLQTMPQPELRTATCAAFGHPDGKGEVELVQIPYPEFWELIKLSPGIRNEIAAEVDRRRKTTLSLVPEVKGSASEFFSKSLAPLGLYQGQSLMLIDLARCTRCDECVRACVSSHRDGRSRLFLTGPRAEIHDRTLLAPTTCQSCEDPVCMIGCPTRAIQRGDGGEMTINRDTCIGCRGCANKCPYNAIQMHNLGLIAYAGDLMPRVVGEKQLAGKEVPSHDWYCFPAAQIGETGSPAWRTQSTPPKGWLACKLPLVLDSGFCDHLAAAAGRRPDSEAIAGNESLYFWRAFSVPCNRQDWDGQVVLKVKSAPESFKVWIDGEGPNHDTDTANDRDRTYSWRISPRKSWRWWRKHETHVLALQVVPNCDPGKGFLHASLDVVRPPRVPWDVLDETSQEEQPKLAVVCDLCHTLPDGPACVSACPHDAAIRFDARGGLPDW